MNYCPETGWQPHVTFLNSDDLENQCSYAKIESVLYLGTVSLPAKFQNDSCIHSWIIARKPKCDGQTDARTDGRTDKRTDGRTHAHSSIAHPHRGSRQKHTAPLGHRGGAQKQGYNNHVGEPFQYHAAQITLEYCIFQVQLEGFQWSDLNWIKGKCGTE